MKTLFAALLFTLVFGILGWLFLAAVVMQYIVPLAIIALLVIFRPQVEEGLRVLQGRPKDE